MHTCAGVQLDVLHTCAGVRLGVDVQSMNDPMIWRRLRVLANPLRLEMLSLLNSRPDQYVQVIGVQVGCSEDIASKHLQMLGDRGFLIAKRKGRYLFYAVNRDDPLASAVIDAFGEDRSDIGCIMRSMTAFTHERRIAIVQALKGKALGVDALCALTGISKDSLSRHLKKLSSRGMVVRVERLWEISAPANTFAQRLINLVLN